MPRPVNRPVESLLQDASLKCEGLHDEYEAKHDTYFKALEDFVQDAKEKIENFDANGVEEINVSTLNSRKSKVNKKRISKISVSMKNSAARKSTRLSNTVKNIQITNGSIHSDERLVTPVKTPLKGAKKQIPLKLSNKSNNKDTKQNIQQEVFASPKTPAAKSSSKKTPQDDNSTPADINTLKNLPKQQSLCSTVLISNAQKATQSQSTLAGADASYSNYDISELRLSDDSDEDDAINKPVPKWAQGSLLKNAVLKQYYNCPDSLLLRTDCFIKPNETFGEVNKKDILRTSSVIWESPDVHL